MRAVVVLWMLIVFSPAPAQGFLNCERILALTKDGRIDFELLRRVAGERIPEGGPGPAEEELPNLKLAHGVDHGRNYAMVVRQRRVLALELQKTKAVTWQERVKDDTYVMDDGGLLRIWGMVAPDNTRTHVADVANPDFDPMRAEEAIFRAAGAGAPPVRDALLSNVEFFKRQLLLGLFRAQDLIESQLLMSGDGRIYLAFLARGPFAEIPPSPEDFQHAGYHSVAFRVVGSGDRVGRRVTFPYYESYLDVFLTTMSRAQIGKPIGMLRAPGAQYLFARPDGT